MNEQVLEIERTSVSHKAGLLRWNLEAVSDGPSNLTPPGDIRQLIDATHELPPLPEISRRLMRLRNDPNANAVELAEIVALDPLLSAQLLRLANSAYYALRNPVTSLRDAVTRALGFDLALNLALGLAALAPLQTPNQGPIARYKVWRHGIVASNLMRELVRRAPQIDMPSPGLLQLAGLTQNIGYLLLGHLMPGQFLLLSRLIQANPSLSLPTIERFSLGVEHTQLGRWLFDAWEMPPLLNAVVRHHHNPEYQGEHDQLVQIACLADQLLDESPLKLGAKSTQSEEGRIELMQRLGLDPALCEAALSAAISPSSE